MKKLAIVLSFVFAAAMIAPAFAQEKKPTTTTKATCAKGEAKDCAATCTKGAGDKKEAAACCSSKTASTPAPAKK
jgi:hypothetical protein